MARLVGAGAVSIGKFVTTFDYGMTGCYRTDNQDDMAPPAR